MHVYCDFDGTISIDDATDVILKRFADPAWLEIEEEWKCGLIGSAECMQRQIPLIRATRQELDSALDAIAIDPSFLAFHAFCQSLHIPITVISDGVDYFIRRILARHHLQHVPIIANQLAIAGINGHTAYTLSSPYSSPACGAQSGVCKCEQARANDIGIYVGDGRSDFCVSDKVDVLFAKGKLISYCQEQGIPFTAFQAFSDVTLALQKMLPAMLPRQLPVLEHHVA